MNFAFNKEIALMLEEWSNKPGAMLLIEVDGEEKLKTRGGIVYAILKANELSDVNHEASIVYHDGTGFTVICRIRDGFVFVRDKRTPIENIEKYLQLDAEKEISSLLNTIQHHPLILESKDLSRDVSMCIDQLKEMILYELELVRRSRL